MELSVWAAMIFVPFVVPVCLYVCYTDMAEMKIRNHAVLALFVIFAVLGLIALPLQDYLWRYAHLVVILLLGIVANAAGIMGAGDSKFAAAAAPFIALGDLRVMMALFAATLLAAFVVHRLARRTAALRRLAPNWKSWTAGAKFPMGLALGGTLAIYLCLGLAFGA
ncbi:prepilin peptidase [Puniceibacterium sp. IMCC21224]|uniref:prepilin peptidase n=1 Tax=Puniceibacterium sp. IMCC21224 TaxID=1618204 RepID=UPI00064DA646|nr:prepilin peptidase [Puniceibacterium sp. IMCC21224]KMK68354.1 type IV leader peptidase [Puniceibacterium sp. IMCC21224]